MTEPLDPFAPLPPAPHAPSSSAGPADPSALTPPAEIPAEPALPTEPPAFSSGPEDPSALTPPAEIPARTRFAEPAATAAPPEPTVEPGPPVPVAPVPAPEPTVLAELSPVPDLPPVPEAPVVPDLPPVPDPSPVPDVPVALAPPVPALPGAVERSGRGLVVTLAVIVALLAGLTGFLGYKAVATHGPDAGQQARQPALQAVRSAAVLLFSYDYRHLDADFKAGRATTTGKFQGEYDKTTAKLVQDVAPRYKAVVIAAVSEASVVSASPDKVVALVFLNQQSTSTLTAAPKVTQSRLLMTLEHRHGTWLVSDISPR